MFTRSVHFSWQKALGHYCPFCNACWSESPFSISDWLTGLHEGPVYILKDVSDLSNLHDDVSSISSPDGSLEYQNLMSNAFRRHSGDRAKSTVEDRRSDSGERL